MTVWGVGIARREPACVVYQRVACAPALRAAGGPQQFAYVRDGLLILPDADFGQLLEATLRAKVAVP
jgi:hypothetical protein